MAYFFDFLIAYVLDLIIGDPQKIPHPVRFIGWFISSTEKLLRRFTSKAKNVKMAEVIAGFVLMFIVVVGVFLLVFLILKMAMLIDSRVFHIINIYFIYSAIATKCLADEAKKVYKSVLGGDIHDARYKISMLVGRETKNLSMSQITKAVVETTAENTVDGVIAPIIYAFVGSLFGLGAPIVYAFKAASTLDSMVGYKNEKYTNLGMASARFDDVLNYLPARISGLIIPFSAFLCGKNGLESFKIMLRDRRNHKSPNCAYPESAIAGALQVQLGGANVYFGKLVEKPTIGDNVKQIEASDINATIRIMYVASAMTVLICGVVAYFVIF